MSTERELAARAIVVGAITEHRLLDLLRGNRPFVIRPEYMSSSYIQQNYDRMWDELANAAAGAPHLSNSVAGAMSQMLESAEDIYLLAYCVNALIQNKENIDRLGLKTPALIASLRNRLSEYERELTGQTDPGGSMTKWADLKRLSSNMATWIGFGFMPEAGGSSTGGP